MSTSVAISDDVHLLIRKKQTELLDKGKKMKISNIIEDAIRKGIEEEDVFVKLRLDNKNLLYSLTKKYEMSEDELIKESLKYFAGYREHIKRKELEKEQNKEQ